MDRKVYVLVPITENGELIGREIWKFPETILDENEIRIFKSDPYRYEYYKIKEVLNFIDEVYVILETKPYKTELLEEIH